MNVPAVECRGCGYDLSGIDLDGACPECGKSIDLTLLPVEKPLFREAALLSGLLSMPAGLCFLVALNNGAPAAVVSTAVSLALACMTFVFAKYSEPRWARKLKIRPEYSQSALGKVFAILTIVGLTLVWGLLLAMKFL